MTLVQFFIIGLTLLILYRSVVAFQKKKVALKSFIFWTALWLGVIILAILPKITTFLSKILGVGRGVDVAVYFSIILIFFLLYKIIVRLERIENEITQIVSKDALEK